LNQVSSWRNGMRVITTPGEVGRWYRDLGDPERLQCNDRGFFFSYPEASSITLHYPEKLERLPYFARFIATLGYDEIDFRGALLWVTAWGLWQESEEAIGYRVMEGLSRAAGQSISFEAAAAYQFRGDELVEAIGMMMQPMIFGWDAYFVPQYSYGVEECFLKISHDSFVRVETRTREFRDRALNELQKSDLMRGLHWIR
jgi:hypothetical protein